MQSLLLIDDNDTDRLFMKKALWKRCDKIDLLELAEGTLAVEKIKREKPLATLLDIRMPGLDGFEVLKMIRSDPDLREHKVFMVSGSEEPSDMELAYAAGANGYLTKPDSLAGYASLAKDVFERVFD